MSILKPEITGKHSKKSAKKWQPVENQNNTKYRNISQVGVPFLHLACQGAVRTPACRQLRHCHNSSFCLRRTENKLRNICSSLCFDVMARLKVKLKPSTCVFYFYLILNRHFVRYPAAMLYSTRSRPWAVASGLWRPDKSVLSNTKSKIGNKCMAFGIWFSAVKVCSCMHCFIVHRVIWMKKATV